MRIITRRHGEEPPVEGAKRLLKTIGRLRGKELIPAGVYRFRSFEEADQWMTQEIANTRVRLKYKTS